ncbi:MAG: YggT family protein [Caldimicrobium sp.]
MLTASFLSALLSLIDLILTIYIWLIIARALLSWITPFTYHPIINFLYKITEPILSPFRRLIPPLYGLDLSPIAVIFLIYFVKEIIVRLKFQLLF